MEKKSNFRHTIGNSVALSAILVFVVLGIGLTALIVFNEKNGLTTSSTTSSIDNIDGVVTGYVTVGSSSSLGFNGYSLEFKLICEPSATNCQSLNYSAPVSPGGHYSA